MTAIARADITRRLTKQDPGIDALVRDYAERVADVLRRFFRAVLNVLLAPVDDGADIPDTDDDTPDADLSEAVLENESLVQTALRTLFTVVRSVFVAVLVGMWFDGATRGRDEEIRRHEFDIPVSDDPESRDDAIERQLRENGRRAAGQVEHRIIGDLAEALVEANDAGMGIPEIAEVLREEVFPDITGWQAERIARSSVIPAHNKGALWAYRDADVPKKEWLAADDHRTRDSHNVADGQTQPVSDPFEVGGAEGMYPGDPSFPPQERINCRCSLAPAGL